MLTFFGDKTHPAIRFAQWLQRTAPAVKSFLHVSLMDGYKFRIVRNPQK